MGGLSIMNIFIGVIMTSLAHLILFIILYSEVVAKLGEVVVAEAEHMSIL